MSAENCGNCVGEQREACLALREGFRASYRSFVDEYIETIYEECQENPLGIIGVGALSAQSVPEFISKASEVVRPHIDNLRRIGCGLDGEPLKAQVQFDINAVATLKTFEAQEEQDRFDKEEDDRLQAELETQRAETRRVMQESEEFLRKSRVTTARIDRRLGRIFGSSNELDTSVPDLSSARAMAEQAYCEVQGWDPKELDFSQELDLRRHLRTIGILRG